MLILGIDPGFAIVGFGLLESERGKQRLLSCGTITTPAGLHLPARLLQISRDMEELLTTMEPDAMAVEEAKTPVSDTSSTPRKPIATARPRNSAGKTTSLPAQTAASSRI